MLIVVSRRLLSFEDHFYFENYRNDFNQHVKCNIKMQISISKVNYFSHVDDEKECLCLLQVRIDAYQYWGKGIS